MRIAVDMDGVLSDTHALIAALMSYKLGKKFEITEWEDTSDFWETWHLMDDNHLRIGVRPMDLNAAYVIRGWRLEGHSVDIVTRNPEFCRPDILEWMNYHNIDAPLIMLPREATEPNFQKHHLQRYDVFIDDHPNFFRTIPDGDGRLFIVYDRPWNQAVRVESREKPRILRAFNWTDVRVIVEEWEMGVSDAKS